jgi:putative DNA primase/helicase
MNVTRFEERRSRLSLPSDPAERMPSEILDSDLANAKRLAETYAGDLRYTAARGYLAWDGRRYVPDEKNVRVQRMAKDTALSLWSEIANYLDPDLRKAMVRHAQRSQQKSAIDAMVWLARSEPGVPAELSDFDADPMLLNVANGTIDLRTGELRAHRREDLITRLSHVAFDPNASCSLWDSFLWRITDGNHELYDYLHRAVGYFLTGLTTVQVLHFLFGLGANGKSVFCEIVQAILGDYAIVVSPEMVMQKRHGGIPNDIARLRGVRVAMMNETSQGSRFNEAKLKDLTGGDTLTGRFLHAEFFDFHPTHKLVIRGNHKPAINGTDEGIWRRLRLVPFTVAIPPAQQDPQLLTRLRDELPGILKWAVDGCLKWQREGLSPPAAITEAVAEYRSESDILGKFIADRCEAIPLGDVKTSVFFSKYSEYCQAAGERWMPAKDLPAEMQRRGFGWKRTKTGGVFTGLRFQEELDSHWSNL